MHSVGKIEKQCNTKKNSEFFCISARQFLNFKYPCDFPTLRYFSVFSPPLWLIVHSSCFCIDIGEHVCVTENTYITFWPHKRRYICDSYNSNKNSPYFYRLLQLNTAVSWLYTIWNVRYVYMFLLFSCEFCVNCTLIICISQNHLDLWR